MALAPRLAEWVAAWRESAAVLAAVQGGVRDSIGSRDQPGHAVYVAVGDDSVLGFVTVSQRTHFTGQVDAHVGELAVRAGMERHGIATRLMAAAEGWAARRGLALLTLETGAALTLETGAANQPARDLYAALGFREEDVRLTKAVGPPAASRDRES